MASISGAFRSVSAFGRAANVIDGGIPGSGSGRTWGCKLIDSLPLQPTLAGPWTIYSWTIACNLWFAPVATQANYGRFGDLYGGLAIATQPTPVDAFGDPFVSGIAQIVSLPPDLSLISQLWDGVQDAAPPAMNPSNHPSPILAAYQLPQPLSLQVGESLVIGLWLTPSVVQNAQLVVTDATWTVVYDEPGKPGGTWS